MPSAASYTNKLRFNTEARNTKIQYPRGVSTTLRPNLPAMCTDFNTTVSTNNNIISTIAGTGINGYSGDGIQATTANLLYPLGLAVDLTGNVYIADLSSHRIRKVTVGGIISTIAGTGTPAYNGDGIQATSARLNNPTGVAVDSVGNIYIADTSNNRIRKVTVGGIISTIAGTGIVGFSGDGGPATSARLNNSIRVAVDLVGNVYIADASNQRIRKVTTDGNISTIAGTGTPGYNGDGIQATSAELSNPIGVAVDSVGNIYIADTSNNRIRKVTVGGIISTIAGTGIAGYSGDGGPATSARLNTLLDVAVDLVGNVYIADAFNERTRKVTVDGIISTIAGTGIAGYNGDGIQATSAKLDRPRGVAVDSAGNVYITHHVNSRVRKITYSTAVSTVYTPPWFTPLDYSVPCNCSAANFISCPACSIQTTIYDGSAPDESLCKIDGNGSAVLDGNV